MTYNVFFTVLTDPALIEETLAHATAAAEAYDAHLEILCLGVDRSQTGYYYAGASAMVLQETIGQAQEDAAEISKKVKSLMDGRPIRWSAESGVAQLADLGRHVAARARYSDLALLPKPYGEGRGVELEAVAEGALFEGGTAAVILPEGHTPCPRPKRILIGWNESAEALAAVRAAMPLLAQADQVRVAVIDPPSHGPNRSDPGGELTQYLARHGMRVEIDVLAKTLPRVSDVLNRQVVDMDADFMVMGAYGHSRFRQAIFGGTTRMMLENTPIPILMAR
jgi:nucleotide-binding universal stress UspA family protein